MKECLIGFPGERDLVNLYDMPPEVIEIKGILSALSKYPRFGARGIQHVSVLRHSFFVALILRRWGYGKEIQLGGFCHDFAEAFLGDLIQPIKQYSQEFSDLETEVLQQIAAKYNCGDLNHPAVMMADIQALRIEAVYCGFDMTNWNLPSQASFPPKCQKSVDFEWTISQLLVDHDLAVNTAMILLDGFGFKERKMEGIWRNY